MLGGILRDSFRPILFLFFFINDLDVILDSHVFKSADDCVFTEVFYLFF